MVGLRFSDDLCLSDDKCISNVLLSQKEKTFQQTDISYDIGRKATKKKEKRKWKDLENSKYEKWNPIESTNMKRS